LGKNAKILKTVFLIKTLFKGSLGQFWVVMGGIELHTQAPQGEGGNS